MSKVELILWYRCNCACLFCSSHSHRGGSFSRDEAVATLSGSTQGALELGVTGDFRDA